MKNYELHKENLSSADPALKRISNKIFEDHFELLDMSQINDFYSSLAGPVYLNEKRVAIILKKAIEARVPFIHYLPMKKNCIELFQYFDLLDPVKNKEILEEYLKEGYMFIQDRLALYYIEKKKLSPYFLISCEDNKLKDYLLLLDKLQEYEELEKYIKTERQRVLLERPQGDKYSDRLIEMLIEREGQNVFFLRLSEQKQIEYIKRDNFIVTDDILRYPLRNENIKKALFDKYLEVSFLASPNQVESIVRNTQLLSYALDTIDSDILEKSLAQKVECSIVSHEDEKYNTREIYQVNKLQSIVYQIDRSTMPERKQKIALLLNKYEYMLYEPIEKNYYFTKIQRDYLECVLPSCYEIFRHVKNKNYEHMKKSIIIKNFINNPAVGSYDLLDIFTSEDVQYILNNYAKDISAQKKDLLLSVVEKKELDNTIKESVNIANVLKL